MNELSVQLALALGGVSSAPEVKEEVANSDGEEHDESSLAAGVGKKRQLTRRDSFQHFLISTAITRMSQFY